MTDVKEEIANPVAASPSESVVAAATPTEPLASVEASSVSAPAAPAEPTSTETDLSAAPSLLETFDKEKAATDAQKPQEATEAPKPTEPAQPAEPAPLPPVAYEYTLPETVKMDDALKADVHKALDAFRADPAKGFQGLIDLHAKAMADYAAEATREQFRVFNDTRRGWVTEVMSDPQLGGSGHQTAMGAIARMRDQFVAEADRPAFEQFLRVTGAGDHPQFLKLLHNVSRFYDEPPLPPANPKPTPTNGLPPKRGMRSLYNQT
jgi:hypothetical protein